MIALLLTFLSLLLLGWSLAIIGQYPLEWYQRRKRLKEDWEPLPIESQKIK